MKLFFSVTFRLQCFEIEILLLFAFELQCFKISMLKLLGAMFVVNGGCYALTAPFWGWLCDKVRNFVHNLFITSLVRNFVHNKFITSLVRNFAHYLFISSLDLILFNIKQFVILTLDLGNVQLLELRLLENWFFSLILR